jgi:hypothetical protein
MNDEFYLGWEDQAAPGVRRTVRRAVFLLFLIALLIPLALAVSQRTIGNAIFEYGTLKNVSGIFEAQPVPHLLVPRPGELDGLPAFSTYYLVAEWKFGLPPESVASFDGQGVTVKGTLIYRGSQTMVETRPDWIELDGKKADRPVPPFESLGKKTLTGEIVDSKCFLGVMNPGQFAAHRGCAIRCISGGVPPLLVVPREDGAETCLLLVSAGGRPVNQQVLDLVGEPVEITGEVERQGDWLILRSDPATYRRAGSGGFPGQAGKN